FFQAELGILLLSVTGLHTCALPFLGVRSRLAPGAVSASGRLHMSSRRVWGSDARELPRVLRAVVPLMCAGNAVVGELIADRFPGLPTVVRALHYPPVPTGGLRRVHPVWIGRRRVQVVDLPAREQRALDVPTVTRSLRCQDERAFPRTHAEPHSAHRSPPCR